MKIVHVMQVPPTSKLCAHACAAMVLGMDLETACEKMKHRRTTRTRELVRLLRGQAGARRLTRARDLEAVPNVAIVRVKWREQLSGHFALKVGGWMHDPLKSKRLTAAAWKRYIAREGGRVTSYLPVTLKGR